MNPLRQSRFWRQVDKAGPNSCWVWRGFIAPSGYGSFNGRHGKKQAHRVSWELTMGEVVPGLTLDHLCRNRACVNPAHLEPVTMKVNVLRGEGPTAKNARKTHCDKGHEFTATNTRIGRDGRRACRRCDADRQAPMTARERRAAALCVQCAKTSDTYRCEQCRVIHNANRKISRLAKLTTDHARQDS